MRASKEECQKALLDINFIARRCGRLYEEPARISSKAAKDLDNALYHLQQFLLIAKKKLPTEGAYDRDAERRLLKKKS